jgi:NAD(P)-dependent dehydrogenase (short-subunit alcohol dehydrogenase family)
MVPKDVVLVTGGTGKLGRSFLRGFSSKGSVVAFTTRNTSGAESLCGECLAWGASAVHVIEADLAAERGAAVVAQALESRGVFPSVVINNARSIDTLRTGADGLMPRSHWLGEFNLGVVAAYDLTMACSRLSRKPHSVVNVASMYGVTAANSSLYDQPEIESPVNYGVVKAALIHLTKELAVRLAPSIRVNAVSFGGVRGRASKDFEARYSALCPAGRMLTDDEVFGPVEFLSGALASGMTGHNLVVDGGWTIW